MTYWLTESATADSRRLIATRALRGFADGAVSILLPSYLTALGLSATRIGIILFGTLFGSAVVTLWTGFLANRFGPRRLLIGASALMLTTGLLFCYVESFWALFVVAFVGTLNPSAGDVSLFLPLEQAALAGTVASSDLTRAFAWYNVAGALAGALGALVSGLPGLLATQLHFSTIDGQRAVFVIYSAVGVVVAVIYRSLTARMEAERSSSEPLSKSRGFVLRLAALFSLDAFSGGFVVQSLLALWLFRRFNLSVQAVGMFFFTANLLGSASQFVSSALAGRIGRVKTMVYTHIPSNLFLLLAALMPNVRLTIAFLLLRSSLSQMDVPARQSYVMAMVPEEERSTAASVTNVPRSLATAVAPIPAGRLLDMTTFGWPLICTATLKTIYDLLLLWQFGSIRPIDELPATVDPTG